MKKYYNLKTKFALVAACLMTGFTSWAQIDVVATAGLPFASYTTLSAAFAAINAGTHMGNIAIGISASTIEAGACVLNSSSAGAASYTAVAISPTVDGVSISGSTTTGRGLIELNGADLVTIDGDNPNTAGVNRNLSIVNTAANTITFTSCVRIASSTLITTNDNITIRNCNLLGSGTGRNTSGFTAETTTWGIIASGGASTISNTTAPSALSSANTTVPAGQTLLNLSIDNNNIQTVARGISVNGSGATIAVGLMITNNTIGNVVMGDVNQVTAVGITAQGTSNGVIRGNIVMVEGFIATTTPNRAINVGMVSTLGVTGMLIEKNYVVRIINNNTTTYPATGIDISGGTNHIIQNNFVGNCLNSQVAGTGGFGFNFGAYGIRIGAGTGHKIYNNSVSFTGVVPGAISTNTIACLAITTTAATGLDIRNNNFSNTVTGGNATLYNDVFVCIILPSGGTSAMNLTLNNNAYYQGTLPYSGIAQIGTIGSAANLYLASNFIAGATAPATNLRSYTSILSGTGTNDNATYVSSNIAPFISASNLHLDFASSEISNVEQKGDATVAVADDIDNDVRPNAPTTIPDIGADEVTLANCSAANGGTIAPASQIKCAAQVATIISTGVTTGIGITYQWQVATVSGGPYLNVSGGSGATTTSYTTGALIAGTYYYVLQTTCSFGPLTGISNEMTLTVNPSPTIGVTPTSDTFCSPGGTAVALTASGGLGYVWSPSSGLSATVGTSVNASPAATTTYTVTGTDINGCTATATTVITSVEIPSITSMSVTPATICSGENSQLNVTGGTTSAYILSNPAFSSQPCQANPGPVGDDVVQGPNAIGFNFLYYGVSYSQFGLCTNGNIQLGDGSGSANNPVYNNQWTDVAIPAPTAPNNIVALAWDDWLTAAGEITWGVSGTAPNRKMTICFNTTGRGGGSADTLNGQIVLEESSNIIDLNIIKKGIQPLNTATQGIENQTGTASSVGVTGRQSSPWSANNDSRVFTSGGGPVTYAWSPGTFLSSTTINNPMANSVTTTTAYTVTVTNGGCSSTTNVTLTVNPLPTVTTTATPSTVCTGASTTLMGMGAASYVWSGGVTDMVSFVPTATTTYTVTGTDGNGCTNTASQLVTVNSLPIVTASATPATVCDGDPTTVMGIGATSYAWSGGVTDMVSFIPTATTTYTVTGTDGNGCTNIATQLITVNTLPTVTASSDATGAVCEGTMVTLTGGGATSYTWDNGVTDVVAFASTITTNYNVTGTDVNGCMNIAMITVTVNPLPVVTFTPFGSSVCDNGSAFTLIGGSPSGGTYSGTGVSAGMFDPIVATAGTYVLTYMFMDINSCSNSDTASIIVDVCSGIVSSVNFDQLTVYPNPTSGLFSISVNKASFTELLISIVDIQGKEVFTSVEKNNASEFSTQINLEELAKGIYYIKLNNGSDVKIQKLIVQ